MKVDITILFTITILCLLRKQPVRATWQDVVFSSNTSSNMIINSSPLAIITGGSRGLGKAMAEQLYIYGYNVCSSTRDLNTVTNSQKTNTVDGIKYAYIDLSDQRTIVPFLEECFTLTKSNTPVVLINNAAVFIDGWDIDTFNTTMEVNLFGTMALTHAVLPYMRSVNSSSTQHSPIIINMSSSLGRLTRIANEKYRTLFDPKNDQLWKDNPLDQLQWRHHLTFNETADEMATLTYYPTYSLSKAALNAFSRSLEYYLKHNNNQSYSVFACTPGWVRTDMGGPNAPLSIEEGIDTPLWLIRSKEAISGEFYRERHKISWY